MITANELRIGNWVTGFDKDGSFGQILSIWDNQTRTDIKYSNPKFNLQEGFCGGLIKDLQPIKLTPEILEAAGFKSEMFPDEIGVYKNCFICQLTNEGLDILDNDFTNLRPLLYLHQLQNLYYALTGEELEINITQFEQA